MVIWLFILSFLCWETFVSLTFQRFGQIYLSCQIYVLQSYSKYFFIILLMTVAFVVVSRFIPDIGKLCLLFFSISIAKCLSTLVIFSWNWLFISLTLFHFLFSISLIAIIYYFSLVLVLSLFCSSFLSS